MLQVPGQLMVPTLLITVPVPVPDSATVKVYVGVGEKVAPTATALVPTVKLHAPTPVQAPLQPAKVEALLDTFWETVTSVPELMFALQVPGQEMPPTLVVTVPEPAPLTVTVTGNCAILKVGVTDCAELIVTVHVGLTPHPPPVHPAKMEAAEDGIAVNVTEAPLK